ncbi:response regulator transcription factor [Anaeromyxobacter paludicola]|uniref:Response regulatory domain-containing protein n=1 Tax=Anaeromyxobacter paludicola TaxID=2918171 RepID=A0ABM7XAE6_9BACT|nr:hypothetical protein [Anaeromyxobacter paludicola]BDG08823.1 hypothetical protein AMPC_19360 [Anaeromyxobacter paludicola]
MGCPRVLVVESDAAIREVLRECLEAEGYPVCPAADYGEARRMVEAGCSPVAVILDVAFPLDGALGTLRLLRETEWVHEAPLLLTTAFPVPAGARATAPVLEKPYELATLLATLRAVLAAPRRDASLGLPALPA